MSEEVSYTNNNISNKDIEITLQLGDVIYINNPQNDNLNEQTFIIDYIDKNKIFVINTETFNKLKLPISEDGILGDGNVTKIELLSRAESPSYARQNDLLPGKWVNIYFGGDYPVIITGEITNLEQDMIELKTVDNDILYINFDYKGIPEDLPIDNIEIREKPTQPITKNVAPDDIPEDIDVDLETELPVLVPDKKVVDAEELQLNVPIKNVKDKLREIIVKANQVVFGDEELGPVTQYLSISNNIQQYSIESQLTDLYDDILSNIPDSQRTTRVLNNIHIMVERFKQLRQHFSVFDQYGIVTGFNKKQYTFKPLCLWLNDFNLNLYWIIPVVKNIKKLYDNTINSDTNNAVVLNIKDNLDDLAKTIKIYNSNDLPIESNKYSALYSDINPYFRPFNYITDDETSNILIEKETHTNINAIIDNLEEFYSSVYYNNSIRNRRFVINKYNLGETKIDTIELEYSKSTNVRVKLTNNESLSIKSILTLPEPAIHFSKINLPGTNILMKANLNNIFLNYWQLLNKKTPVSDIFIENIDNEIEFDENNFANSIKNYVFNIPNNDDSIKNLSKEEIYNKYTNTFIPKIKVLFNLMKKYINDKLSIVDVVSYLEPFLIYTDDLTYSQYREIIKFIDQKISNYNKELVEFSQIFKSLSNLKSQDIVKSKSFSIYTALSETLFNEVIETGYQIEKDNENITNSEILRKIIMKDNSKLYTTALKLESLKLMFSKDIDSLFEMELRENDKLLKFDAKNNSEVCPNIIITKLYTSIQQLENDNNKITFFDKRYDKTNYGIMEEDPKKGGYSDQVIKLSPENLKEYIIRDQMAKNKLNERDATYLAETLIDGNKKVLDGQYALLYKGYAENLADEYDYYVRKNNKWVLDNSINKNKTIPVLTDEQSIICDLKDKCMNVVDKNGENCEDVKTNKLNLQNALLNDIISEFDVKYKLSKEQMEKEYKAHFDYLLSIMPLLFKTETNFLLKYNNQRYKMGANLEYNNNDIVSPFTNILNVILSEQDFVKKQTNILKFADKFTHSSNSKLTLELALSSNTEITSITSITKIPAEHWLYCIKTNTPLLPAFKKELAAAFFTSQEAYINALERIKSTIGTLSDDGSWWSDKYSGWPICPVEFDVDEGYDEGFKISTRAVIEEDAGNKFLSGNETNVIKYITPETIMINNIINSLSLAMGINIETQKEFIINCVLEQLNSNVENENEYKEKIKLAAKKSKTIPSYKDYFNKSLLYFTFGMFLIAVQTAIPSVKTRKTYPGCVRSFNGYPFDGQGDYSSLNYLACISFDIRVSGEPWNVLKKSNIENIQKIIQATIDTYLIQLPDVQRKFTEKTEYLLTNPSTNIPELHDVSNWNNFLPPLVPFKIKHLDNISSHFNKSLLNDLKNGTINQTEKLLVIQSKIILFSLAIQEKITNIVKTHKPNLHTINNEPYLENSCCNSNTTESFIDYFISRDNDISNFNLIVQNLVNILYDVKNNTQSLMFYSNINTKNIYPPLSNSFNEKTIYLAFIFYCKFRSLIPIPINLLPICTEKPESILIHQNYTLENIIQKLKDEGRTYTTDQFLRLIQLISRENIIESIFHNPDISTTQKLSKLLEAFDYKKTKNEIIQSELRDLLKKAIDTFDTATEEYSPEVKDLNNYLIQNNKNMVDELIEFVKDNTSSNISKKTIKEFTNTIQELSYWNCISLEEEPTIASRISSDCTYKIIQFYKTYIENFTNIFPNIILKKVFYDYTTIPDYYNFSSNHEDKLIKFIASYFEKLKPFYVDLTISKILNNIQLYSKNILLLSENTPCFSSININMNINDTVGHNNANNNDTILKGILDESTSRNLFEHYLLSILFTYIELADDNNMIVTEVKEKNDIANIVSVDYIEENETKIDLSISFNNKINTQLLSGNKKLLRQKIAELLIAFIEIFAKEKEVIDITYGDIQDKIFKIKQKEKNLVTDRLKEMTDEQRDLDTTFKIIKQGIYSKGTQKGLTMYDKDYYESEQELRDQLEQAERTIRKKNKNANDENIDILVQDFLEECANARDIELDAYDIGYLNENYYDGNYDGFEAPEEECNDYEEEY